MDRETLDRWLERGILALVLLVLVLGPVLLGGTRQVDFVLLQGLTAAAGVLWLARFWVNPKHRIQWPPICWAVIGFVSLALIRYSQAEVEYPARWELMRIVTYALIFLIVLNNLHRQETTQVLTYTLMGLGMVLSVYAIYQYLTNSPTVLGYAKPLQYKGRGSGTYICPNHLAGLLELILPLGLANLFLSKAKPVPKIILGYMSLAILGGIAVTVSRGGWVATALTLLIVFGLLLRYRSYRIPALLGVLIIAIGVYGFTKYASQPKKRFTNMFTPGQLEDTSIRSSLWKPAVQMWQDHPWLGVGPAHFDVYWRQYRPVEVQTRPYWPHNDYLSALSEWGAVGGGIILLALVLLGAGFAKTWRFVHRTQNDLAARRSDRAAFVMGSGLGIFSLLIHSLVDFNMQIPANAILAIALMAALTSHLRFATDNFWVTPRLLGRILATLVLVPAIYFLSTQGWRGFREHRLLEQANVTPYRSQRLELWLKAFQIDPRNDDTAFRIGEAYRRESWNGNEGYEILASGAMRWFEIGMRLNPFESQHALRYGMCLDWLGRHAQAEVFMKWALKLDPNSYYITALQGWHAMEKGELLEARMWFERSLKLNWYDNSIARQYLDVVNKRLSDPNALPPK